VRARRADHSIAGVQVPRAPHRERAAAKGETAAMSWIKVTRSYDWTEDDSQWFKQHPERSYRLRGVGEEELAELKEHKMMDKITSGFVPMAIVRQLIPGVRVRGYFGRLAIAAPLSEDETFLSALFEITERIKYKEFFDDQEIIKLAMQKAAAR